MIPAQTQQAAPQGVTPDQIAQAQMQTQAAQGLGTPPPPQFEYKPNPSMALMDQHIAAQQEQLATKMANQKQTQGYAGYRGDPTAGVQTGSVQQGGEQLHPNTGWSPSSPEAHQLNVQLADRIKSGSIDPNTAMIALQHPEVSPEVKQALSVIVQQAQAGGVVQSGGSSSELPVQGTPQGLGSVGIPQ